MISNGTLEHMRPDQVNPASAARLIHSHLQANKALQELATALRLTAEYVGQEVLPAREGWSWYDALQKWDPEQLLGFDVSDETNVVPITPAPPTPLLHSVDAGTPPPTPQMPHPMRPSGAFWNDDEPRPEPGDVKVWKEGDGETSWASLPPLGYPPVGPNSPSWVKRLVANPLIGDDPHEANSWVTVGTRLAYRREAIVGLQGKSQVNNHDYTKILLASGDTVESDWPIARVLAALGIECLDENTPSSGDNPTPES